MKITCWAVLVFLLGAGGCASSAANMTPSSSQPAYANRYADSIEVMTKGIADRQAEEKQLTATFGGRVDQLKKPDWQRVSAIVQRADAAGKSAGYAETQAEANAVRAFWSDEQAAINGRVAGAAQHTLKESGCTADVGGATTYALKDGIDKQLEKRARAKNDAFVLIERYSTSLGRENTTALEKLAEDVARSSWIVNVDLVEQRERLKTRLKERDTIKKTLDQTIADERAFQAEPGRTDAEKKASEERIAAATKNKAEVDKAGANADDVMKSIDKQIDAAKTDYEQAKKALDDKIAERAKADGGDKTAGGKT